MAVLPVWPITLITKLQLL